jgi:hypothetical protein
MIELTEINIKNALRTKANFLMFLNNHNNKILTIDIETIMDNGPELL